MGPARRGAAAALRLAHTIASMDRPEDFLLDVATSGNEEAVELLITALKELDGEECCFAVLDAIVEADRREDVNAQAAAKRLFHAVRDC